MGFNPLFLPYVALAVFRYPTVGFNSYDRNIFLEVVLLRRRGATERKLCVFGWVIVIRTQRMCWWLRSEARAFAAAGLEG